MVGSAEQSINWLSSQPMVSWTVTDVGAVSCEASESV